MRIWTRSACGALAVLALLTLTPTPCHAAFSWPPPAPALPAPTGTIVDVSTVAQLQNAVANVHSNSTIRIAPGTYDLTSTLWFNTTKTNIALRGKTGNRNDVIIRGLGMANASYGNVPHCIWVGNVQDMLIADLTITGAYYHLIQLAGDAGCDRVRLYNLRLYDGGEQFVKGSVNANRNGVDDSSMEYCLLEFTTVARWYYTCGIDIHTGNNWTIRYNLFKNIRSPPTDPNLTEPAVHMWDGCKNTLCENNVFYNCERGIMYGMMDPAGYNDHEGGIIRNNFVYRAAGQAGDVGIHLGDSPSTKILNNTVILSGTYYAPIEYRYTRTTGVLIANNLCDGQILLRDGASATLNTNLTNATSAMFANLAGGDPHLAPIAAAAINHGTTLADCLIDFEGQARPAASVYDIGADEFGTPSRRQDFNGDRKADVLFRHPSGGDVQLWLMN